VLINFLLGAMFVYLLLPLLDDFLHVIHGMIEVYTAKCNLKISEYTHQISELGAKNTSTTHKIGFRDEEPEKEDENYED
jgi:hypothetical protein